MKENAVARARPGRFENRLFALVLQHPQERGEPLATAQGITAVLHNAAIAVGLSWPNLSKALGRRAEARRWGVLYLGSAKAPALAPAGEVIVLDQAGNPAAQQAAVLGRLDGAVLLDGTWSQAKTLWWRNPWLLKLHRIVLNPLRPSRYGMLRREPRGEALSSLEAAALLLRHREDGPEIEAALLAEFDRRLAEAKPPVDVRKPRSATRGSRER
ncbi:MAG: DTW domain-containing protein [Alphaproteobacteria bacterium]|nr:DTW domain-containing protein [Alphaproteobacteria bacterium]